MGFARIHFRLTHKTYKGKVSSSEEVLMYFPKELHGLLRCISERRLEIKASREGKVTVIMLRELDEPKR